jgi:hypothetical protein
MEYNISIRTSLTQVKGLYWLMWSWGVNLTLISKLKDQNGYFAFLEDKTANKTRKYRWGRQLDKKFYILWRKIKCAIYLLYPEQIFLKKDYISLILAPWEETHVLNITGGCSSVHSWMQMQVVNLVWFVFKRIWCGIITCSMQVSYIGSRDDHFHFQCFTP